VKPIKAWAVLGQDDKEFSPWGTTVELASIWQYPTFFRRGDAAIWKRTRINPGRIIRVEIRELPQRRPK